jgi:hypothetical protein
MRLLTTLMVLVYGLVTLGLKRGRLIVRFGERAAALTASNSFWYFSLLYRSQNVIRDLLIIQIWLSAEDKG